MARRVLKVWLLTSLTCWLPAAAAAQPWADAYRAGDHAKAAELLQPIVVEQVQASGTAASDPAPARHLAVLYARGSGVGRDPVLACALARLSQIEVHGRQSEPNQHPFAYKATMDESERFVRANCEALTPRQRLAASRSLGCFAFGMPEGTLAIGEQTVWFDRLGLRLSESGAEPSASDPWCFQLVARIASRTIAPPSEAAPGVAARSFVEVLGWEATRMPGDPGTRYVLSWTMFELRKEHLAPVAVEHLLSVTTWPRDALPPDFETRLNVEMIRSGHIRWRLDGAPPQRGWIMLPEGDSR